MSHVMCHVSRVTCHVSRVMCHVSPVTCKKFLLFSYIKKERLPPEKIGQSGGASRWRVCYQRGLPRLVLKMFRELLPHTWLKKQQKEKEEY